MTDPSEHAPDPAAEPEAEVHDVLAADEFAVGTGDPALHHGPFEPPADPSGIEVPHDVLAAEEFAVPAGPVDTSGRSGATPRRLAAAGSGVLAAGAAATSVLLRRRRHRSRLDRLRRLRP